MKKIANLDWKLMVYCDCCEAIDLAEHDDDLKYTFAIFNNKWDDLKGEEFYCPKCGEKIFIEEVVY